MTYHTLDDWLGEIENFATRQERLAEEIRDGTITAVMPWMETAWRLGGAAERWAIECNKDMGEDAKSEIRKLLMDNDVPVAAFIDDHVRNAIVQRNQARERIERLEKALQAHSDFWDILVRHFFGEGCLDMDGGDFQVWGTRCGLLRCEQYDPEKHGPDGNGAADIGCDWYVSTGLARAALAKPEKGRE